MEPSILSENPAYYGSLHNFGHDALSYIHDPDNRYNVNTHFVFDFWSILWIIFVNVLFVGKLRRYGRPQHCNARSRILSLACVRWRCLPRIQSNNTGLHRWICMNILLVKRVRLFRKCLNWLITVIPSFILTLSFVRLWNGFVCQLT